ncbi:MAG: four helix bundle protein [bacterium]
MKNENKITDGRKRNYNPEGRTIDFAVRIIQVVESLPKTRAGNHIAGQLIRCGTSPASNYGEAQGAESRSDFIHKMNICLKELRETRIWLTLINKTNLIKSVMIEPLLDENEQLISVFATSVRTARKGKCS